MSRLPTPATIEAPPTASRSLLEAVRTQLGVVPNLFRLIANSPAALEGHLGLSGALAKGCLPAATRERIALAVAEINGCSYCLSAHTYLGKNLAKLELKILFEEMRRRGIDCAPNGEPRRGWSTFINKLLSMPVTVTVATADRQEADA